MTAKSTVKNPLQKFNSYHQRFKTTSQRFFEKVDKSVDFILSPFVKTPCWIWFGHRNKRGYGSFSLYGRHPVKGRIVAAHRVAWMIKNGKIPEKMRICHECDNPSCVRLSHLFIGTDFDNVRDKIRKGRGNFVRGKDHYFHKHPEMMPKIRNEQRARGEEHGQSKLKELDVVEIRIFLRARFSHREIAAMYGVSKPVIGYIKKGKWWRHVVSF